ncbi:MAG: 3-methyl-2-oxobutanoate hydroxymethyltransferase [Gammaproteobacteria bacterium]
MGRISITDLKRLKGSGERIACLTAYDATFARLCDRAGVEMLLVGDSLGMVIQGGDTTLEVRLADMIYHTRCVRRGSERAIIVADMPFMSYATPPAALGNAARLLGEGGAQVVKLEGGAWLAECVRLLCERGIPVCGHLGLTPQSIHRLGGYRVQGREPAAAEGLRRDAKVLSEAGAVMLVLECVPRGLAAAITTALDMPVIGIGAGGDCDGQVLVLHDLLGATEHSPRFSKDFLAPAGSVKEAFAAYVREVKSGAFPGPEHGFD